LLQAPSPPTSWAICSFAPIWHDFPTMSIWAYLKYFPLIPVTALGIELFAVGWQRSAIRRVIFERDHSRATDLFFFLFELAGLHDTLIFICSMGLAVLTYRFRAHVLGIAAALHLRVSSGNFAVDAGIYLAVYTFFDYWNHRIEHWGPFWFLHRLHHSATSLSPMVSSRNHPVEIALEQLMRVWPLAFCAISPTALMLIGLADWLYQFVVHIDVRWSWGWFGRWVLLAPAGHRIHHSPMPEHFNKNLAIAPIWDHLFGTWYAGSTINEAVGLGEPVHNNGNLAKELFTDVCAFGSALITEV
jgi:sterol desaturase/sphingolipid hydroxylase (fatty acid hydroxylase superfamily)